MSSKSIDGFWRGIERMVRSCLSLVEIDEDDADDIADDLMRRLTVIPIVLPLSVPEGFHVGLGACTIDLVTAEQRLVAARSGRMPGLTVNDWPPLPIGYEHPFLAAVQAVVNQIEMETRKAGGGGRAN